jgi:hypothetical protein
MFRFVNKAIAEYVSSGFCPNQTNHVRKLHFPDDVECELSGKCFQEHFYYDNDTIDREKSIETSVLALATTGQVSSELQVDITDITTTASLVNRQEVSISEDKSNPKPFFKTPTARKRIRTEKLAAVVRDHATPDGHIVLLMATSGYFSLLHNFFCFANSLPTFNLNNETGYNSRKIPFLVVTSDSDIEQLSLSFDAGVFNTRDRELVLDDDDTTTLESAVLRTADFGTLLYQQLMLSRTELTMELLLLGFSPVIADIDTLWLKNPLNLLTSQRLSNEEELALGLDSRSISAVEKVPEKGLYDIAVTDDDGEVCGCFVAINPTKRGLQFWKKVLHEHQRLIRNAIQRRNNSLLEFTDSEQKILTKLIYGQLYVGNLRYRLLAETNFPSGHVYFNHPWSLWSEEVTKSAWNQLTSWSLPIPKSVFVVHNNFIIGLDSKIHRFDRHGLWQYRPPFPATSRNNSNVYFGSRYCYSATKHQDKWKLWFSNQTRRDRDFVSLDVILPRHNQQLTENTPVMALVETQDRFLIEKSKFQFHVHSDPPTWLPSFGSIMLGNKAYKKNSSQLMSHVFQLEDTTFGVAVDIAMGRNSFGIDFLHSVHPALIIDRVQRVVVYNNYDQQRSDYSSVHAMTSPWGILLRDVHQNHISNDFMVSREFNNISTQPLTSIAATNMPKLTFVIKILTFNRPKSLLRLLESLRTVDWSYFNYDPIERGSVHLEFLIDGHRDIQVLSVLIMVLLSLIIWG